MTPLRTAFRSGYAKSPSPWQLPDIPAFQAEIFRAGGAAELAVATAIALFGFQSGAALSAVVGLLVEVPVMLSVVQIVKRTRGRYERG